MTMTLLQLQVLELVIIFLRHFSQPAFHPTCLHGYFTFLLINDVRMTTFTQQLLSKKHQRLKSDNASANRPIPAAVLRMGYAEIVFIQPGGKLHTILVLGKD